MFKREYINYRITKETAEKLDEIREQECRKKRVFINKTLFINTVLANYVDDYFKDNYTKVEITNG